MEGEGGGNRKVDFFIMLWDVVYLFITMYMGERAERRMRIER